MRGFVRSVPAVIAVLVILWVWNIKLKDLSLRSVVRAQDLQAPQSCQALPVPNPLQVAVGRWYHRNQTARIAVVGAPAAFDGDHVYVLGSFNGAFALNKVRASDGAVIDNFTNFGSLEISSLNGPIAFDGVNLWVALTASDAGVAVIRARDGSFLSSGSTPTPKGGIVFDGASVWLTERGSGLQKLALVNGNVQFGGFFAQPDPVGIAFDGQNLWVADSSGTVLERTNTNAAIVRTVSLGGQPQAIVFDGVNVWVTDTANNQVDKIRVSDGSILGRFPTDKGPSAVVFDGENIWVGNTAGKSLTKIRACDGNHLGTFAAGGLPSSLVFDGSNVWFSVDGGIAKF